MKQRIQWAEPPEPKHPCGVVQRFAEALRERPGEWALFRVQQADSAGKTQIRLKAMGLECVTRKTADGRAVYARAPLAKARGDGA